MATTTASVSITSDLLTDAISVNDSTICMKNGSASDGLNQMDSGYIEIATGDQYDLLGADNALNKDKANKVLISNDSTDETYYVIIEIKAEVIGRLYAGDWMFIPWGAEHTDSDIEITSITGTNKITYAYFHEGRTLVAS